VLRRHAGLVEPSEGAGNAAASSGFEEVDLDRCDSVPGATVQDEQVVGSERAGFRSSRIPG
jgi:hypothetical protein